MFEELLKSVREGGAILRGQKKPSRRFEIGPSGILAIHERTSLSQSEFALDWRQRQDPTELGADAAPKRGAGPIYRCG